MFTHGQETFVRFSVCVFIEKSIQGDTPVQISDFVVRAYEGFQFLYKNDRELLLTF